MNNNEYEALLNRIDELKDICQEIEQKIIDERHVDVPEYRSLLSELFQSKLKRDYYEYNDITDEEE